MNTSNSSMSNRRVPGEAVANPHQASSSAATQSLQLLLRDDYLLTQHELHITKNSQEAAYGYAAALLQQDTSGEQHKIQQRATDALQEVERKLALVQSLAERVSRTSPEAVAGPLLRLHGYSIEETGKETEDVASEEDGDNLNESNDMDTSMLSTKSGAATTTTLVATRDRCDRLQRQSQVLEGVAKRVESSLQRGLTKMEAATSRLSRVLILSSTLKMILRLQFEANKLQSYDLDDLRDLTRAAASVAIVENLLKQIPRPEPQVVVHMRPTVDETAAKVRAAAALLLEQHQSGTGVVQLGATLQVYYHLGELPQAAWSAVGFGLETAKACSKEFWSPSAISALVDESTAGAKSTSKTESALQRNLMKVLRERRREASTKWAAGIAQAALQVWNLHRVLCRKSDPVSRQVFSSVVAKGEIPPNLTPKTTPAAKDFSVFSIFWEKLCFNLGKMTERLLQNEKISADVAALYPAVRSAVLGMLGRLYDTMQASSTSNLSLEDTTSSSNGILGGSNALDNAQWSNTDDGTDVAESYESSVLGVSSADTWTRTDVSNEDLTDQTLLAKASGTTTSLSSIFSSPEWKLMQTTGLQPLQTAFLSSCRERLCAPIEFMFPAGLSVDEDGVAMQVLPTLPSRYDLQKLDHSIRSELSLADPREGGGDLSMTNMIAEAVVDMVERFCARTKTALTNAGEDGCLTDKGMPTERHLHDRKVGKIMSTLATTLKTAPENTFVVPYRPATSPQHEEAATLCQQSMVPAIMEIEKVVKTLILAPLGRALNRRVAAAITKMHHGTYLESTSAGGGMDSAEQSFVQKQLVGLYEDIAEHHISKLPPEHAAFLASTLASFSIYTFVSNASLIRPLGENARLRITHDLAEFELALEQLILKGGSSLTLSQIEFGKPYAELRAVRQMFYWSGLNSPSLSASSLSKSLLREVWIKDVRPSTTFHFLFSFAPTLLSSPHHFKRMRPEDYVNTLVQLDGNIDEGEASAWMITMACCDSYQQRESIDRDGGNGDRRIAAILMMLGPELLRRRRH
mmetsp:Transcript_19228/g.28447  ORF Transcript_19228/g.28447 Transcript_19228/m.28447 type:complete len:1031 (-) Transcript_19228:40-3132(-)